VVQSPRPEQWARGFVLEGCFVTETRIIDEIVAALRDPSAYPWRPQTVEVIETHISWVFLAGDRVLKMKRPVTYSFVDYSTRELRRSACEDEVRLNRRLTHDVYLGVVPVARSGGRISVDSDGEPLEWATLMRRLPADGMLDHLLAQGGIDHKIADDIASRLIAFHRDAAEPCVDEAGTAVRQAKVVLDNLTDLEPFAGSPLPATQLRIVAGSLRAFCEDARELLNKRVAQRWIREGHGDLRTDHICLDEQGEIQIFDCVEFNKNIRCADISSDVAFLLLDLERLGADQISARISQQYRDAGLQLPEPLLRFYRGHRALVKVKVSCLSWRDLPPEQRRVFFEEAMTYLDLATAAATTTRPFMIAMTGLSGTGKSVVATALARALGATILSTDDLRRESGPSHEPPTGWETGKYVPAKRAHVYAELFDRARDFVRTGRPVILDATFLESDRRQEVARAAVEAGVPLIFVHTVASDEVVRARLKERSARGDSPSEATIDIYEHQAEAMKANPPVIPETATNVLVDTSAVGPVNFDRVFDVLLEAKVLQARIALE
jgi:aminoglycoside phosphotransferase family enzyme/predicted kinase